ncbi:MAG: protease modulator HflC [Acidiferrobacterales bacterium]|nr:protease modulator HflC [Acidiferrobacterales bacterium]
MKRSVGIVVVLALAYWIISTSLFAVDETEVAVVTRFGEPLEEVRNPGLQVKMPWPVDRVIRVDMRKLILKSTAQELLTDDEKNVIIEMFLTWQVVNPMQFVATVQNKVTAEAKLHDLMVARLGAIVGNLALEDFINVGIDKVDFHFLAETIREQVDKTAIENFGVGVLYSQINGFTLPVENRASVVSRMKAERARIAARYRSEGAEEALKIEAKAAAEHERILARAHAEATKILGEAEAESLQILGEAYAKDPEFYRFIRSLESYESIIGEQTTLFLESDSKLLKVLNGE